MRQLWPRTFAAFLLLSCLAPVLAQGPSCPPVMAPDMPQGVAEKLLATLRPGPPQATEQVRRDQASMLLGEKAALGCDAPTWRLLRFYARAGAVTLPPQTVAEGRVVVPVTAPALSLEMTALGELWMVDIAATYASLPEGLRGLFQQAMTLGQPEIHPETQGAGGPAPPAESLPPSEPATGSLPPPEGLAEAARGFLRAVQPVVGVPQGAPRQALAAVAIGLPNPEAAVGPHAGWDAVAQVFRLWSLCGAVPGVATRPQGDRATVLVPSPPLALSLTSMGGKWRVDLVGTSSALPPAMRAEVEAERARLLSRSCLEHLRRLLLATALYASAHGDRYPDAERWTEQLAPYLAGDKPLTCPDHPQLAQGYAFNTALSGRKVGELRNPEEVVVFFDSDRGTVNAAGGADALCYPGRHNAGNNYVLADGRLLWSREPLLFTPRWQVPG